VVIKKEGTLIFLFIVYVLIGNAQQQEKKNTLKAIEHYRQGNLKSAKLFIDEALLSESEIKDAQTWYWKGHIYKKIFVETDSASIESKALDEAVNSFLRSNELDKNKRYEENMRGISFLADKCYNQAVINLRQSNDSGQAILYYEKYKSIKSKLDLNLDVKKIDVSFYLAIAGHYAKRQKTANLEEVRKRLLKTSIGFYSKVLEISPNNYNASYNVGIMYYNEAVELILKLDPETPIEKLVDIQEKSRSLLEKALPYIEKAEEIQPNRMETVEALAGIYFHLKNSKHIYYNRKLVQLREK